MLVVGPLAIGLVVGFVLVSSRLGKTNAIVPTVKAAGRAPVLSYHAEFTTGSTPPEAGTPVELKFAVKNAAGANVRYLQFVHERPMHLLVVSDDLREFYHIHPELQPDDTYQVSQIFPAGGHYTLYADYTPPGSNQIVDRFSLDVAGPRRPVTRLTADRNLVHANGGIRAQLRLNQPLVAGREADLTVALKDTATGQPVTNLQFYLGALAHLIVISEDRQDFIHAHPLEPGDLQTYQDNSTTHIHNVADAERKLVGPSPSEITARTTFPRAGLYKVWAQFQRDGQVVTIPFVVRVGEGHPTAPATLRPAPIPADAIVIRITSRGYEPARVDLPAGRAAKLAFIRTDGQNCGGTVVFPELGIRQEVPVGGTVVVNVPAQSAGTLNFGCGMGMLKGALVVGAAAEPRL